MTRYDSGTAEVRAFLQRAWGNGPVDGTARAYAAVLAVPKASAAPTTVTIVEFYNAALDHYFITANPQEMADLDNGVHVGWARTGQSFNGYGIGSTGDTDRRPVCRAYGSPAAGLDSHFYSASPDECLATLQNGSGNCPGSGWISLRKLDSRGERGVPDGLARSAHRRLPGRRRAGLSHLQSTHRREPSLYDEHRDPRSNGGQRWHRRRLRAECSCALRVTVGCALCDAVVRVMPRPAIE